MNTFAIILSIAFFAYFLLVGPCIALEYITFRDCFLPPLSLLQKIIIIFLSGPVMWGTCILGLILVAIFEVVYYLYGRFLSYKIHQFWNWAGTIDFKNN